MYVYTSFICISRIFWPLFCVKPAAKRGHEAHIIYCENQTSNRCTKLPPHSLLYLDDRLHINIAVGTPVVACCTLLWTADECCTAINQDQAQRKPKA